MALKVRSIEDSLEGETIKKLIISVVAVAMLSLMIGGVFAEDCCPPPPCCECNPGLSPGFWKHNVGVYLGLRNGAYSDPTGSPVVSQATMEGWLGSLGLNLPALYDALNTKGGGAAGAAMRVGAANEFNALAGLEPYMD